MNTLGVILTIVISLVFVGFLGYEVYALIRDIKKHREKKKSHDLEKKVDDDK